MMNGIASLIVATSALLGQAQEPSAYEHLKGLEWLVGDMVGHYTVQEGWGEFIPVGTKITRRSSTRWDLNRSVLKTELSTIVDGQPPFKWLEMVGWDPISKEIKHWIFWPGGGVGSGVWTKEGDDWQLRWTSQSSSGSKYAGISRMRVTGDGTFSWRIMDATKDGQKIADIPTVQFKKTDAAEASGFPDDYLDIVNSLVGEWKMEGSSGDAQFASSMEVHWASHRQCLEYRGTWNTPEGLSSFSGVIGWDPARREVVFTECWTGGGYNTLRYPTISPGVLEGTMAGVSEEGQTTGGQIRLEIKDTGEVVFTSKKAFRGDQVRPDTRLIFRRR